MMKLNLQYFGGRGSAGARGGGGSKLSVAREEAYEDYFEYENAQLMKEYSKTGKNADYRHVWQ